MFDDDGNIKCQLEFSYFRTGQNVQEFKEMAHMSLWVMYLPETRKRNARRNKYVLLSQSPKFN